MKFPMDTTARIIEALEDLKVFFDWHKVRGWTQRTEMAIQQMRSGNRDTSSILKDFVGAGMGSLIDVYISADNGHHLTLSEAETNEQLERLVETLLILRSGIS